MVQKAPRHRLYEKQLRLPTAVLKFWHFSAAYLPLPTATIRWNFLLASVSLSIYFSSASMRISPYSSFQEVKSWQSQSVCFQESKCLFLEISSQLMFGALDESNEIIMASDSSKKSIRWSVPSISKEVHDNVLSFSIRPWNIERIWRGDVESWSSRSNQANPKRNWICGEELLMKYEFAAMGFDFDWLETNKKISTVQNYTLVVLNRKKTIKS